MSYELLICTNNTKNMLIRKWIPIIIYLLNRDESMSCSDLLINIEYISNKRLSTSLNDLLTNEMIIKQDNKYKITKKGQQLAEIFTLMSNFTGEYN